MHLDNRDSVMEMVRCFLYVVKALYAKEQRKKNWLLPVGLAAVSAWRYLGNREGTGKRAYSFREIRDVRLSVCGETAWLKGLVDTGNCLYDGA